MCGTRTWTDPDIAGPPLGQQGYLKINRKSSNVDNDGKTEDLPEKLDGKKSAKLLKNANVRLSKMAACHLTQEIK